MKILIHIIQALSGTLVVISLHLLVLWYLINAQSNQMQPSIKAPQAIQVSLIKLTPSPQSITAPSKSAMVEPSAPPIRVESPPKQAEPTPQPTVVEPPPSVKPLPKKTALPPVPKPKKVAKPKPKPKPRKIAQKTPPKKVQPKPIPKAVVNPAQKMQPTPTQQTQANAPVHNSIASAQAAQTSVTTKSASFPVAETKPLFNAAYLNNPAPKYPRVSRRRGETGKVLLKVNVSPQGRAAEVKLYRSSGSRHLDKAAHQTVTRWQFVPAKRGNTPISAWVIVPIEFKLR